MSHRDHQNVSVSGGINPQDSTLNGLLKGLGKSKFVYHSESHRDCQNVGVL